MCHECGDEEDDIQFSSEFIDALQELPPEEKENVLDDMQESIAYVMEKAEQQGFLFELITSWPRTKVAMYEAAVVMEKNILDDGHTH
jgi:hypothetical protein